jgi:hypothetical protein
MKRGCLAGGVVAGALALLGAGITVFIFAIFSWTQPVVDGADDFLALLGQGKIAEAYASTADAYRAAQDEASFAAAVKQHGLTEYASATWYNRRLVNSSEGTVQGTVTTKDGGSRAVAMRLVQEQARWKVAGIRCGDIDLATIKLRPVRD